MRSRSTVRVPRVTRWQGGIQTVETTNRVDLLQVVEVTPGYEVRNKMGSPLKRVEGTEEGVPDR